MHSQERLLVRNFFLIFQQRVMHYHTVSRTAMGVVGGVYFPRNGSIAAIPDCVYVRGRMDRMLVVSDRSATYDGCGVLQ